jgi:hypothetical protein
LVDPETKQARMLHLAIARGHSKVNRYLNSGILPILRDGQVWDYGPHWHGAYQSIQLVGGVRSMEYAQLHQIKTRWRKYALQAVMKHLTCLTETPSLVVKANTSRAEYNRNLNAAKLQVVQARRNLAVAQWERIHQLDLGYLLRHYMIEDSLDEIEV